MDFEKIIQKLKEIKVELEGLKKENHSKGKERYYELDAVLRRIIDRIYPEQDAKRLKSSLVRGAYCIRDTTDEEDQKEFVEDLDMPLRVINTILEEFELFGFDDFKPVKEKVETEGGLKTGFFNIKRRVTKEK